VDVDATGHLLIIYSAFVKYLRKNGNTMKQCTSYLHLSAMFPISNGLKQGDALSSLLNFAVEYTIRRVQVNKDGLKLNGTCQLLVYADDVNILGGSVHTTKKNRSLVVASTEIGLEVKNDKTNYMVMFLLHLSPVLMSNNLYHQNWKDIFYVCQHITKYF